MTWQAPNVVIEATSEDCLALAKVYADAFKLPLASSTEKGEHWTLKLGPEGLHLQRPDGLGTQIDFVHGKAVQRSRERNFASQPLARALGLQKLKKNLAKPNVIDATAGFGTDGWMIASLGCDVRLLEASPVLSVMLEHAIKLAQQHPHNAQIEKADAVDNSKHNFVASRLSLINTDAINYLSNAQTQADVVYLDPMYPPTRSSALVKKGMQLLHELIGPDNNGEALLNAALACAQYRVVVKRPKGAEPLAGSENWAGQLTQVSSAQTRFDIYHTHTV